MKSSEEEQTGQLGIARGAATWRSALSPSFASPPHPSSQELRGVRTAPPPPLARKIILRGWERVRGRRAPRALWG